MGQQFERIGVTEYQGLDLNSAKIFMDPGAAQISTNFDYRKRGVARVRAGYARLLGVGGNAGVVVATDDFDSYANGSALEDAANWTARGTNSAKILSSDSGTKIRQTSDPEVDSGCEYSASALNDNQYAQAVMTSAHSSAYAFVGVGVRSNASKAYIFAVNAQTAYMLYYEWGTGFPTGQVTKLVTVNANDVIRIEAIGTVISGFINGTKIIEMIDSNIGNGKACVFFQQTLDEGELDNFECGNIVSQTQVVKVDNEPTYIHAFERDDDRYKLVVANGLNVNEFDIGSPEWQ